MATGVVITADGPNAAEVNSFTLRTANGQALEFIVGRLELGNGGLPSAHLREHMVSGEPITVSYHVENGANIADRYTDATVPTTQPPLASTAGPTPTASPTPTSTPSPESTAPPTQALPLRLDIEPFADGFQALTFVTNAGDGTGLLYVVEQRGVIWRIAPDGTVNQTLFLDITDRVGSGGERGLLGLAFHPGFADNGRFFLDYTDRDGDTVVSEFEVGADGLGAADSEGVLLGIDQPFANHNGGMLAFGPDGYLYIGTGDGGSAGDPQGNGQSLDTLLGKILRIDVNSGGDPYGIPPDNPWAGGQIPEVEHGRPEIWDWGLRNPWRFSFDRATGALWIGDVGQGQHEEVDAEPAGAGGRNYGWNVMEATHCYAIASCDKDGLTLPVAEYSHRLGCSITGGYVYRGRAYPGLVGQYVFSDYCSGNLWAIDAAEAIASGSIEPTQYGTTEINPTTFGEDESGELYVANGSGQVFRLVAR